MKTPNPNDPKIKEQINAFREVIPRLWFNVYQGCLQAGFSEKDSMILLQTYILATNANGIIAPGPNHGPESDNPDKI